MKILIVNTRHFRGGGDATYTFNLAELLRQNGHTVSFFAMQDERNLPDPNSDLFVSAIDFRELNQHKSLGAGLRVATRVIYSREARQKFRQLLARVQPDLVHLQNLHGHLTPSVIFEAKAHGLPVAWTLHDYKQICPNSSFINDRTGQICEACGVRAYYQPALKRCKKGSLLASGLAGLEAYVHWLAGVRRQVDVFLTPAVFMRNKLLSRGFDPQRVQHLSYCLPESQFAPAASEARDYLLFMGRLENIKGVFTLLEAARLAPNVKLILAGTADPWMQTELATRLPANAQYVGMQQGEALRKLLAGAMAVVVPSINYENQPFSILEAFGARKPVIASNLGGMTELVTDGERGRLVPPGEPQALAEAMQWLSTHAAERQAWGENAYRYVVAEHSSSSHYQKLMAIYAAIRP
jgi:glycosyltransferase involved in cell wall biosynthesis